VWDFDLDSGFGLWIFGPWPYMLYAFLSCMLVDLMCLPLMILALSVERCLWDVLLDLAVLTCPVLSWLSRRPWTCIISLAAFLLNKLERH